MTGKLSFIIKTCLGQYSAQMAQPLHQVSIIIISGKVAGRAGRTAVFKLPDAGESVITILSCLSALGETMQRVLHKPFILRMHGIAELAHKFQIDFTEAAAANLFQIGLELFYVAGRH